jgi:GDP-mannose 6-dehydrogenase
MVLLAERLIGRGYDILIHDANVSSSHLVGANRAYVESHLPHLSRLLRSSVDDVLDHAEICVIGAVSSDIVDAVKRAGPRPVLDLVRLPSFDDVERYEGICW